MNSLKTKILGLTISIMVAAVGLTAWHNLRTQRAMLSEFAAQNSRILGDTIRNSIITDMSNGQNDEVGHILQKIKKEPNIVAVRIFDETGRILISADPAETGDLVSPSDLLAYRSAHYSFSETVDGQEYHSTIVPIYNAPLCHACHDPKARVLGILNVHISLAEMNHLRAGGQHATLFSFLGMLGMLILTITIFILRYVDQPIRKLATAMSRVEKGEFSSALVRIQGSREMLQLGNAFNLMVERLKALMETTIHHERELAVSQEKLAHQDEIQNMNITLEERLKEIEYLNITLEERIEEIEEANYKIADLASDLESKNTHLAQAVDRLSVLYKLGLVINSTMEPERLFGLLLRRTMDALKARVGYILLREEDGQSLRIGAALGIPGNQATGLRIGLQPGGVSHWVVENRQPLLIRSIEEAEEFSRVSRLGFTRETVICAPLVTQNVVIGTLTMANREDGTRFSANDLELLSTIAAQASVAINNAHLYEEQQITYLNTVQALVSAVEAKDAYTRGHSERVTRFSLALAKALRLSPEVVKHLEQAAILHDIGKIGIEGSLLHKKQSLSTEEVDLLHQHPLIGVRILEPIRFLKGVRDIIGQHHERFDGKGYPLGLKGKGILIEARILAVADTFDAMTSDRPYRQARGLSAALQEIQSQAGTQFDPEVVAAFVQLFQSGALQA